MSDILKKHMQVDEELDEEVRRRIKNLEEGTSTWEVEYGKVLDQIKRNRGLDLSAINSWDPGGSHTPRDVLRAAEPRYARRDPTV
jgi:hypothetical protein